MIMATKFKSFTSFFISLIIKPETFYYFIVDIISNSYFKLPKNKEHFVVYGQSSLMWMYKPLCWPYFLFSYLFRTDICWWWWSSFLYLQNQLQRVLAKMFTHYQWSHLYGSPISCQMATIICGKIKPIILK